MNQKEFNGEEELKVILSMEETILTKIHDEHSLIMSHIKLVEDCQDIQEKHGLYKQLKAELLEHLTGLEKSIYRHLREDVLKESAREISDLSHQEHHQMKEYLQRLNLLSIENQEWPRTFCELKHLVQMHCDMEEMIMFNEAKEDFSREELIEFASEYENSKHETESAYFFR